MVVRLTPAQGALRALRGAGLAITAASLSVAAHAAAGGSLPDPVTTAIVTALLVGAGTALADRRRGPFTIVGALGLTQLTLHLFLQLSGSHQGHQGHHGLPFDPAVMVAGHLLAAVVTGLVLARAEQALFVVARVLALVLPRKHSALPVVVPLRTVCIPAPTQRVIAQLIRRRIHTPRGPPLHC